MRKFKFLTFWALAFSAQFVFAASGEKINWRGAWNFDGDTFPVVKDNTGNNHDGIIDGNVKYVEGKNGKALEFDGMNGQVKIRYAPTLLLRNPIIECWVKPYFNKLPAKSIWTGSIQGAGGDGFHSGWRLNFGLMTEADITKAIVQFQVNFGDKQPVVVTTLPKKFPLNEYMHIKATYDHEKIRLYINGELIKSRIETREIYYYNDKPANNPKMGMTINKPSWGKNFNFKGIIDDLKVGELTSAKQKKKR